MRFEIHASAIVESDLSEGELGRRLMREQPLGPEWDIFNVSRCVFQDGEQPALKIPDGKGSKAEE